MTVATLKLSADDLAALSSLLDAGLEDLAYYYNQPMAQYDFAPDKLPALRARLDDYSKLVSRFDDFKRAVGATGVTMVQGDG
ncbi:MAG: hypothetical protein AAFY06_00020 [Pseudomonadota bacterium]